MSIILTGATGFLGSHLLRALLLEGWEVTILKRSTSSTARIADLTGRYRWINIDQSALCEAFTEKTDIVIHCATAYGRDGDALSVLEGNIQFPVQLMEEAIKHNCSYFINTDSFFCKQLPERLVTGVPLYLPEYTLSKYQFREWGKLRAAQGAISFINLQMEHIYGPGDNPAKFVPWLEAQFRSGAAAIDLTDGTQFRDFIHVDDVTTVYCRVLKDLPTMHGYQSFEVGTGQPITVRAFVKQLKIENNASTELHFGAIPRKPEEIMFSAASLESPYVLPNLQNSKRGCHIENYNDCNSHI